MAHSCLLTNADDESGHVVGLWVTWPLLGVASVWLCLFPGMCCVCVTVKLISLLDVVATGLLGYGSALEGEDRRHFSTTTSNAVSPKLPR